MRTFKTLAASVIAATLLAPAAAEAKSERTPTICEKAFGVRQAVIKKHGKTAPGRNICRFGVETKRHTHGSEWHIHTRDARTREKASYLRQLRKLVRPPRYSQLVTRAVPPAQSPAGTRSAAHRVAGGSHLASIRSCESGGNYRAVDPSGTYRGAYQFDRQTWASVGGSGDPAAASPAEQDRRAAMLYAQRGASPWPVCGR